MRCALFGIAIGLAGCAAIPPGARSRASTVSPSGGRVSTAAFLGATGESVREALGPPRLTRTDGPAEVWLYRTPNCRMTLVLYRDSAGTERVATAAALGGSGTSTTACAGAFPHPALGSRAVGAGPS